MNIDLKRMTTLRLAMDILNQNIEGRMKRVNDNHCNNDFKT
jgi:hypothetical protein